MKPKPEGSNDHLSRHESSRRGVDLRDQQHAVEMTRQDSVKPPSSSRHRDKDADIIRSSSQVDTFPQLCIKCFTDYLLFFLQRNPDQNRSKRYEKDGRRDDDRDQYRDDTKRSDSRRYTSDVSASPPIRTAVDTHYLGSALPEWKSGGPLRPLPRAR